MNTVKRAIIIHCWEGYPDYCWYPWVAKQLEESGIGVAVPTFPDTDKPHIDNWVPFLQQEVGKPDEQLVLIGHSIGAVTIMRYLETLESPQKIAAAILVAGFTDPLGFTELENYFTTPLNFTKMKDHCSRFVAIHSDNDPYVPLKHADILEEKLNAEKIIIPNAKHFSGPIDEEASCTELPEVVSAVLA